MIEESGGSIEIGESTGCNSGNMCEEYCSAGEALRAFNVSSCVFVVGKSTFGSSGTQVGCFLKRMWPNELVEIFGGIGLLGCLGLTGANANCANLCFVEIPEGTLAEGVVGDSVKLL